MAVDSALVFGGALALVGGGWFLAEMARARKISPQILTGFAAACLLSLVLLALSDWPAAWLNDFWTEHSIVGALVSTLLLVGAGLLGLEARGLHEQERLSEAMAGTAFAGLVGPLIDVDTALFLLADPGQLPDAWDVPGKPLRWIRDARDTGRGLDGQSADLEHAFRDGGERASRLIDQMLRRLVGSARDWAALGSAAVDGRAAIATFGRLRNDLTELQAEITAADPDRRRILAGWSRIRAEVQLTAVALERASLVGHARRGLDNYPTPDVESAEPVAAALIAEMLQGFGRPGGDRAGATRLRELLRRTEAATLR